MAEPTPEPTPQQIQQTIQQVQSTTPTPIEFKTDSGAVFKGNSWEEIAQQMKKSVESGSVRIRELSALVEQRPPEPPAPPAPNPQDDQKAEYWRLWQDDPIKAEQYALSVSLGVPIEQVQPALRGTLAQAATSQQEAAGNEFLRRCPDFPQTQQNNTVLIQAMQQRYAHYGPPRDAMDLSDRLESTYNELVRRQLLQPAEVVPTGIQGSGGGPIPGLGSSLQSQGGDVLQNFRNLTPEQMKATLEKLYQQGVR